MAGRPNPPGVDWADGLRLAIAARRGRRRRVAIAALAACSAMPLAATMMWKVPVLLVWNASSSAPLGLYRVHHGGSVRRGDLVVAWTPRTFRSLAARRRYLPANVPLVKRVAAVAGDDVCAAGRRVTLNGRLVAVRQESDSAGRPMPWWGGCQRLSSGEYLLLTNSSLSFDGRYFGVTRRSDIVGRAGLVREKPAKSCNHG